MPLLEWHIKSTTKAQQGLYEYDAVSRLRDSQLGDERVHDIANYIVKGMLWQAFESGRAGGAADRRDRQGRHRVPQRPAARARPHGVLRLRDAARRSRRATGRSIFITSQQREGAARRVPAALLLPLHPLPRQGDDGGASSTCTSRASRRSCCATALEVFFEVREVPGLKKKPSTSELLDWLKLLLAEDIPPEALRSEGHEGRHPAAARRAAEERAGRAPVRAADLHAARAGTLGHRPAKAGAQSHAHRLLPHRPQSAASRSRQRNTSRCSRPWTRAWSTAASTISTSLARITLVKDEALLRPLRPRLRRLLQGRRGDPDGVVADIPAEWLQKHAERWLTDEEKAKIEALGGWEKLMETLKKRLEEQKGRHQGGSEVDRHRRHLALRRLRLQPRRRAHRPGRLAQPQRGEGVGPARVPRLRHRSRTRHRATSRWRCGGCAASRATARPKSSTWTAPSARPRRNAGWLDLKMGPERHNAVKVLLFLDIGGSMDDHIKLCRGAVLRGAHASSSTSSTSTSTTASTSPCGRTTAAATRAHPHGRRDAQVRPRLQAHLRRRRDHEPLRARAAGRQRRALERRGRGACGSSACCAPVPTPRGSIPFPRTTGPGPRRSRTSSASWTGACIPSPSRAWSAR